MAKCPKCGVKLYIWNFRAECPKCGVNIPNYDWEARLEKDSEIAEAASARLHAKIEKFRYSFIGTKLRIARIPISVLPLFGFLLPFGTLALSLPFFEKTFTLNAISIVMMLMKFDIGGLFKTPSSEIIGDGALMAVLALAFVLLSAASLLVSLYFLMFNYRNFKSLGLFATNFIAALMMTASGFCYNRFLGMVAESTLSNAIGGSVRFGIFLAAGLFLFSSITNLCVAIQSKKAENEKSE